MIITAETSVVATVRVLQKARFRSCDYKTLLFAFFVVLQLFLAKTVRTIPIGSETVHGGESSSDLILDNHNFATPVDGSNTARLSSSNRARAGGPTIIQAHIVVNTSLETPDDVLFSIHDATETLLNLVTSDLRKINLPEDLAVQLSLMYVYPTGGKEYYTVEYIIFDGMSDGKPWVHPRTEAQNWKMLIGKQSFTGSKDRSSPEVDSTIDARWISIFSAVLGWGLRTQNVNASRPPDRKSVAYEEPRDHEQTEGVGWEMG
ncbi:hypothetical protein C8J55DRAFT_586943 [Lentinula edodes]|uniref:Uncharacterized protein n=1 Tax=Lentinula lateritia TaxID=40482 RepID=A0A9W9DF35_9AGAR|nr:hypothetical protein C8J55DRAFT_586943 [Lentinula edodes]